MIDRIGTSLSPRWHNDVQPHQAAISQEIQAGTAHQPENAPVEKQGGSAKTGIDPNKSECQTCKKRKYRDVSDDPGVSMQTPTTVNRHQALFKVASHEQEHVIRERVKAEREGREVVMQSVRIESAICPECGRSYISGGETRTVTREKPDRPESDTGSVFDSYA